MKILNYILFIYFCFSLSNTNAQLILNADGPGETYELITSKLAPGDNPIEVPDCGHNAFGRHIDEVFDDELNENVFRFLIHTAPDDDRCINFDRQRNEVKSYSQSPDSLLGIENEIVEYKWKFKLPEGFQSSPKFTHIHQLKAVGGSESSMPLITLTTRKNTPDELELRYAEALSQVTLHEVDLAPFIGTWCEATETVLYGESGTYDIVIRNVADNSTLFSYSNNDIRMWKTDADFIRPKWGIYRSLEFADDLRDEEVLYNDFSIWENPSNIVSTKNPLAEAIQISPNPSDGFIRIIGIDSEVKFEIFDVSGKQVLNGTTVDKKIQFTHLPNSVYYLTIHLQNQKISKKLLKVN